MSAKTGIKTVVVTAVGVILAEFLIRTDPVQNLLK